MTTVAEVKPLMVRFDTYLGPGNETLQKAYIETSLKMQVWIVTFNLRRNGRVIKLKGIVAKLEQEGAPHKWMVTIVGRIVPEGFPQRSVSVKATGYYNAHTRSGWFDIPDYKIRAL